MNRSFTFREKILMVVLAILALGCIYYLGVLKPSMETMSTSETRMSDAQGSLTIVQSKYSKYQNMKTAIEQAKASGAADMKVPDYDSTKAEMTELDSILSTTIAYTVTFGDASLSGSIVRRPVTITYGADSYADAESVMRKLLGGTYSCLVTDFSITQSSSSRTTTTKTASTSATSGAWTATVEAVMFEKATNAASSLPKFEDSSSTSSGQTVASQLSSALLTS